MAGHSHATNVKWRKDRQSKVRSKIHQKARRDIELLIQEEGKLSEKALNIARQHNFSKEKVYQIWEKIRLDKKRNDHSQYTLYQTPFGIWLCSENNISDKLTTKWK
jgi:transcriptional/translational regulatory protein YebC/TACO1